MTVVQQQCLLRYLGYYQGAVDGIFGPASRQATKDFQAGYGLKISGLCDSATEEKLLQALTGAAEKVADFWEEVQYFAKEEFRCKCGGKYCDGFPAQPEEKLVRIADRVRSHFGAPAIVSSGVRCETHNGVVGGAAASRHITGKAMDFCVKGKTAAQVLDFVKTQDVRYAYAIDGNYVHMDVL